MGYEYNRTLDKPVASLSCAILGSQHNCQLKNISSFYVAWRKGVRKLLSLPYNKHCVLLICHDTTIDNQLDRRVVKFLASCKISNNTLVKLSYNLACSGSQSVVGSNMTFLCSKYCRLSTSGPEELPRREESSPLEESPTRDDASHREDVELVPATTARVSPSQMRREPCTRRPPAYLADYQR